MKEQLVKEMLTPVPTLLSTKIVKHSRLSSLDINDLQTDDDLREAHDLLSVKLKDLIAANAPVQDQEILRNMLSHIKLKFQTLKGKVFPQPFVLTQCAAVEEEEEEIDNFTAYKQYLKKKAFKALA